MSKLKINKFAIRWNALYLWVNPFAKGMYFWRTMRLNIKIVYTFFKGNFRRFYRWLFKIEPKPLTEEGKLELANMLRGFLEDVKPMVDKIHTEAEYSRIKKQWKNYKNEVSK